MKMSKVSPIAFSLMVIASSGNAQDIILTLTSTDLESDIALTRADLQALPQHQLTTSTSVTDGQAHFEGFLIRDLLDSVDISGDSVIATALNDYQMEIPASDFARFDVLGAISMDGKTLSPRDKGPIWIVYPRDDHAELQDIRYDTRWVWQLTSLHVE